MRKVLFILISVMLASSIGGCRNGNQALVSKKYHRARFTQTELIPYEDGNLTPLINNPYLNIKLPESYTRYQAVYNDSTGCFLNFEVSQIKVTERFRKSILYDLNIINLVSSIFNEQDTILHLSYINVHSYGGHPIDHYKVRSKQFKTYRSKDGIRIKQNDLDKKLKFHFTGNCNNQFCSLIEQYPSEIFFSNLYCWNIKGLGKSLEYISPQGEFIKAERIVLNKDSITDIQVISIDDWAVHNYSKHCPNPNCVFEEDSLLYR